MSQKGCLRNREYIHLIDVGSLPTPSTLHGVLRQRGGGHNPTFRLRGRGKARACDGRPEAPRRDSAEEAARWHGSVLEKSNPKKSQLCKGGCRYLWNTGILYIGQNTGTFALCFLFAFLLTWRQSFKRVPDGRMEGLLYIGLLI